MPAQRTVRRRAHNLSGGKAVVAVARSEYVLLFGGWAASVRPLALRPRIASGLLLSDNKIIMYVSDNFLTI